MLQVLNTISGKKFVAYLPKTILFIYKNPVI
jgi:hypothetical protein